jgi:hypothetical protein
VLRHDPSPPGSPQRAEAARRLEDARQDLRAALGEAPTARALAEESAYLEDAQRESERQAQVAADERVRARDRAVERRDRARRRAVELMAVERANQERLELIWSAEERAARARDVADDVAAPRTTYSLSAYHEQVEAENLRAEAAREAADALARAQEAEAEAELATVERRKAEDDAREAEEAADREARARDRAQRSRIRAEHEAATAEAAVETERRKGAEAERRRRVAQARAAELKRSRTRKTTAKKVRTDQRVSPPRPPGPVGATKDQVGSEQVIDLRPGVAPDEATTTPPVDRAEPIPAPEPVRPGRTRQETLREARLRQVSATVPEVDVPAVEKIRLVQDASEIAVVGDLASAPRAVPEATSVAARADLLRLVVYVPALALLLRPLLHRTAWLGSASALPFVLLVVAMATAVVGARLYRAARADALTRSPSHPGTEPAAERLVAAADRAVAELRMGAQPTDVWDAFETSTDLAVPEGLRDVVLVRQDPDALLRFAGVARPGPAPRVRDGNPLDVRARAGMLLLLVGSVGVFLA